MYSTSTICTVQNNVYVNMSVYFVCILVERGTSGGRVAGHVTASGPLGTCVYVQGVQNSGYSGLRKVQPKVFQWSPALGLSKSVIGTIVLCTRGTMGVWYSSRPSTSMFFIFQQLWGPETLKDISGLEVVQGGADVLRRRGGRDQQRGGGRAGEQQPKGGAVPARPWWQ